MAVQRRQGSAVSGEGVKKRTVAASESTINGTVNTSSDKENKSKTETHPTPTWVWITLVAFIVLTVLSRPSELHPTGAPTIHHVFFYGWLTAISTGLGALPFLFLPDVATYWVGISNAIAAGMMIGASYSLFVEGCVYSDPDDSSTISSAVRTTIGAFIGLLFIFGTKKFLDEHEDVKVGHMEGTDARKALLIFLVMLLHSFSEGVGIGVSFGGIHGSDLGVFISASLAIHNIPEGLAIAVVLYTRGSSVATAALWAMTTSLPQPVMAVPAYMFVHHFIPVLPVGLGFAGGAMAWVAFVELLMEAVQETHSVVTTMSCTLLSLMSMLLMQTAIAGGLS